MSSRTRARYFIIHEPDSDADRVTAPGASCRTQLGDRDGTERPPRPVELLADALD